MDTSTKLADSRNLASKIASLFRKQYEIVADARKFARPVKGRAIAS